MSDVSITEMLRHKIWKVIVTELFTSDIKSLGCVCLEVRFALQYLAVACNLQLSGVGLPMCGTWMLILRCDCGVNAAGYLVKLKKHCG